MLQEVSVFMLGLFATEALLNVGQEHLSSFLYINEIVQGSGPGVLVALEVRFGTKTYITLLQLINL